MDLKETGREILVVILASVIIALTISLKDSSLLFYALVSFLIIIVLNVVVKKIVAYYLEADLKTKLWSVYQYGFRKASHFKVPLPMVWLPLVIGFLSRGFFWWLGILEFDLEPRTERVSRRHGLYRFSEITEWHLAVIAVFGVVANLVIALIGYLTGFEQFARFSIYFAAWNLIPFSSLDGSKVFFGSKALWIVISVITAIFLGYALLVF